MSVAPVKFILINNEGPSKTVEIGRWTRAVISAFLIGLPVSLAGLSYEFGVKKGVTRAQAAEETLAAEEARGFDITSLAAMMDPQRLRISFMEMSTCVDFSQMQYEHISK